MKIKNFKKGHLFLLLALLGIGVLIRYALRDMRLDIDLLREGLERMPTLVVENLEFEREISGDLWRVWIPLAERGAEATLVTSVDVRRRMPGGREWY
ncbi:MAG: hypothetical protein LBT65_10845, partial [Synergistaceae bacterium]|nr:hypothetical protein [Synergistaceae bacterium]